MLKLIENYKLYMSRIVGNNLEIEEVLIRLDRWDCHQGDVMG